MQSAYLNNRVFKQPDDTTRLLYYLKCDPDFQRAVNRFWQVFPRNAEGQLNRQDFVELATTVYTLLLPQFTFQHHRRMAEDTVTKLVLNGRCIYDSFIEFFVEVSYQSIENVDLRAAVAFVSLLFDRVLDVAVVDSTDPEAKVLVGCRTEVHLYLKEDVDKASLQPKFQKQILPSTLYYEERVMLEEGRAINDQHHSVVYSLKKQETIIPLGFLAESVLWTMINDNFQTKDSYKAAKQERLKIGETPIITFMNEKALDIVKDAHLSKEKFNMTYVLHEQLPQSNSKLFGQSSGFYRLGEYFSRPVYFEQLKTLKGDQSYFNILSVFYDRNEFGIDEIHNVAEKWHRKKKASILGEERRQTIYKEELNLDEEQRLITMKVLTQNLKFANAERLKNTLTFLRDKLRVVLDEDKVVNFEKYLSQQERLPTDAEDPFEDDIIEYAHENPLQLLIIGRPKCGKSTLAKRLATKYQIVHVSVENSVNKIFERVKFFEENPPEMDDNGVPKDGLTTIEKCVLEDLQQGRFVGEGDLLDLLNVEMKNPATASKGYILDLPLEYGKTDWIDIITSNRLYTPKVDCRYFSHVIELEQTDDEWRYFSRLVMEKDDLTVSSGYERYLLTKPKPPKAEDDEDEEDQEEKPPALKEETLVRVEPKVFQPPNCHSILNNMHPRRHLKLRVAGKNVQELLDLLDNSLERLPQAKKLEGADKELLTVGLEEKKLVRKWSKWGIVDPVELLRSRLINGKSEFAAEYAGRVFLFENEKNQADFLLEPRKYLKNRPRLPPTFNVVINGPRKSGKKSLARQLNRIYGLKLVDIADIVSKKLLEQKNFAEHIPSNPMKTDMVHLSEAEWKDFSKGNALSAKDILPMVLHTIGVKLQKKPQDWGVERTEEEKAQLEKEREEKEREEQLKKAQAKKNPKKKEKDVKEDDRPKTAPPEDIALKDLIPEINHFGKLNEIRGFIFVGFPSNEQQLQAFRAFNIPIDKYIFLNDNSQENPNKNLSQRLNDAELEQVAAFTTAVAPVKDALTEEVFKEVLIGDTVENLTIKVRNIIDPFFLKPDEETLNRTSADVQEEDPIQFGFCEKYCPVVLNEGWLVRGKDSMECGVQGRRYRCFDEKELNQFKQNPGQFIDKKKLVVPPRILFMGVRGVGLRTELIKINSKYKIPIMHMQDTLISHIANEKIRRRTERYYNKGFKIPEYDEEGKKVEDPELNDDGADFDRKANEVQVIRNIFNGIDEILINGNFFDVDEEKVSTGLVELLTEARRLPEAVVILKVDEKRWLPRVFNIKEIEKEHEAIVNKLREDKQKERLEAKQKALEAGEQYQQPAQQEDLGAPKLQDMVAEKKEKLVAQHGADMAKLDEYTEAFKAANVDVLVVDCQRDVQHVYDKIVYAIRPYLENRLAKWDRVDLMKINPDRITSFLENCIVKESRFGRLNPLTLLRPIKPLPLLYNNRMYYLDDEEQREAVMDNIALLRSNMPVPKDVSVTPIVFIIGKPKTGKGSLAKLISKKLGLVIIKIKHIVQQFATEHRDPTIDKILQIARSGEVLSDELVVDLIERRVQLADCVTRGWILDGMPRNKSQAEILIKRGLAPSAVFSLQLSDNDIKKRVAATKSNKYGYDPSVVNERIQRYKDDLIAMENYFMNKYNNIRFLDGRISKWGVYQAARSYLLETVKARQEMVRAIACHQPISAGSIGLSFNTLLNSLSDYLNFCLVTHKTQRQYAKVGMLQLKHCCLYQRKLYVFNTEKQLHDFSANPDLYVLTPMGSFHPAEIALPHQLLEVYDKAENKGYCMVELTRKQLLKGNPAFTVEYKEKLYGIGKASNIRHFLRNPTAYELSKLQDKLPVEFDKKGELKEIAKRSDCTAFLQHHLGNIMMRVLAQLGYRRLKYPTVSSKETALKFLAISLKANNPNKDEQYREKYKQKLERFIKHCSYSQELRDEFDRKKSAGEAWRDWDEQNLLKLAEEYKEFDHSLNATDRTAYFSQFIN